MNKRLSDRDDGDDRAHVRDAQGDGDSTACVILNSENAQQLKRSFQ